MLYNNAQQDMPANDPWLLAGLAASAAAASAMAMFTASAPGTVKAPPIVEVSITKSTLVRMKAA